MMLRQLARKARSQLRARKPHPAILMYHRVVSLRNDPWDLAVPPDLFEKQMSYIRKRRIPMAMQDLIRSLCNKTLPPNAVAVTFDDGYRDNLIHAQPILARYGVPATVFVATGYVGQKNPFWWDELAMLILECKDPVHFMQRVNEDDVELRWGLPEQADLDPAWRGWEEPRTARQKAYVDVWSRLQSAPVANRDLVLSSLRASLQCISDPLAEPMTASEYSLLTAGGVVTLGAHTVTHRALTDLERMESRREIEESGIQCRTLTPNPIEGFAYPYGNFDDDVRNDLAQSSLSWGCTTVEEFLDSGEPDLFSLPRLAVKNSPIRDFHHLLTS